jgi:glycosyltransferase involved in cell wall biosynthesis
VKQHLLNNGFESEMRVITNGMEIPAQQVIANTPQEDPIIVICIGRLANEKSQETLLEAMKYSRHAHRIQLHFAGKGPYLKKYTKIADKLVKAGILRHTPCFGFYNAEELKALTRKAYLYIHCALIEVEGLSCAEAVMEGVVPVIGEGRLIATPQFALDERSLFPVSDSRALAERIDWWIEHPEERIEMGKRYVESIRKFNAEDSTRQIIQMYKDSIAR